MNKDEIETKVKDVLSKGAKASKDAFDKASDKVQVFTDKSVLRIEKHQFETKRDVKYKELGMKLSQLLCEGATVTSDNQEELEILNSIQSEIVSFSEKIKERERLI